MTKSPQFHPDKSRYSAKDYTKIYINEIVNLYGILLSIILDSGAQLYLGFGGHSEKDWVQE